MPAVDPRPATPTTDLFREAIDETKELVRLEVALAKREAMKDVAHLKAAAIGFGVAAAAGLLGVALLLVALALAIAPTAIPALIIGAVLLAVAAGAGVFAWKALPRKPLDDTRKRLETDARLLKERIA
jgi:uncharacterized membrane protein YqjE